MDSHDFDASGSAVSAPVQNADLEEQQARAEQDAFEQQLDAARMADSGRVHGHPGRKPPANVSGTDRDYIWAMMEGVSKRRKLSHASTEKYTQMLYKVAAYLGERGQSLEGSDNKTLSELSERVFKKNKHVGVALQALQELRGGVGKRKRGAPAGRIRRASSATAGRRPVAPTEADAPLIESIIEEGVNTKHWAPPTVQHHRTTLRKLSNSLGARGETIAGTSDAALSKFIEQVFPENWKRMTGSLCALREHRGGGEALKGGSSALDGVERAESMAAAGSSSSDVIPEKLYRLLDNDVDEWSLVAEAPELLRMEQELREHIAGGPDDESTSLPLPARGEELTSDPEDPTARLAKRRRVLNAQYPHSITVDAGRFTPSLPQLVPAERSQLDEPVQFDPDPFADDAAGPIDPEAFIFAPLPLSPGELSRLLDGEPMPPQPNQLADERAGAVDTEASVIARPPLSPGELWRLLGDDPMPSVPDQFAVPIDPDVFNFRSLPRSPDELGRLLDDAPATSRADQFTGWSPNLVAGSDSIDFEYMPFSPGELRRLLDDDPASIGINRSVDNLPVPADPDGFIFNEEQMPPGELRRLLDDEPASPAMLQPPRRLPSDY
ncbi:hypothetical protein [Bradyrhizobium uaiense]|uniref:Uncharacterized protein n=1 Tax=Bradyrhizobium uaiense TaxID=2594946 RepID=A0A6P1BTR3_9BRAD|nr:hypothetical protein [Bradyrhizobium uaiense]NEV01928.1 hypothetical protein [Bradyrhizobium uaiense]